MLLVCVWVHALSHAPQFSNKFPMTLKYDAEVSQVTYFKTSGLNGVYIESPREGAILQASFSTSSPTGTLYVGCVANKSVLPPAVALVHASSTLEPFTQSRYWTKYDSTMANCSDALAVYGRFAEPWSVVVGKQEKFSAWELFMFPVYSAKLHGSWWNKKYVYHWPFFAALIVGLFFGLKPLTVGLFIACAADRFAHAWTLIALADLVPALLVLMPVAPLWWIFIIGIASSLWVLSSWWLAVVIASLGIFAPVIGRPLSCVFIFGSGYYLGPLSFLALSTYKWWNTEKSNDESATGRNCCGYGTVWKL